MELLTLLKFCIPIHKTIVQYPKTCTFTNTKTRSKEKPLSASIMEFLTVSTMLLSLQMNLMAALMLIQVLILLIRIVAHLLVLLFILSLTIGARFHESRFREVLAVYFLIIYYQIEAAVVTFSSGFHFARDPRARSEHYDEERVRLAPAPEWLRNWPVRNLDEPTFAELTELGYDGLLPGKQCTHAVKDWFRGDRTIRRSRSAIFREIILASGIEASEKERLISSYLSGEDRITTPPPPHTFSKFPELPPELRILICREVACVPRLVNVASVTGWPYGREVDWTPPMQKPEVAHASRELHYETRRHHGRSFSTSFEIQPGHWGFFADPEEAVVRRLVGFVRPTDTLYYGVLDSRASPMADLLMLQPDENTCHPRDLARTAGSTSVACWWNPEVFTFRWDPREGWLDRDEGDFVATWSFLRDIPSLKTLWISWIGTSPGCETYSRCGEDGIAIRCRTCSGDEENFRYESRIRVMVPLFDDERIAEVLSLDSHVWDCEKAFHTVHSRLGRHCLHCERTRFQQTYQRLFPLLWVMLWIDELLPHERWNVVKGSRELNTDSQWVRAKLASMPIIEPYLSFQLFPQTDEVVEEEEEDPYEYEDDEEESVFDYTSVSYRGCSVDARRIYARHYETPEYPEEFEWDRETEQW